MNLDMPALIERMTRLNVLVIGEAMLDSYLEGDARRLCREAPVPIVTIAARADVPGGAANSAANARSLGARVRFRSVVGDDAEGDLLLRAMEARGVTTDGVLRAAGRRTLAKHRVLASSHMLVRFDQGSGDNIDPPVEDALIAQVVADYAWCDVAVVSDYSYGVLTPAVVEALASVQRRSPRLLVVDAKDVTRYRSAGVTAAKPNYAEAVQVLGVREIASSRQRVQQMASHGASVLERTGAQIVAVTLDGDGALVFEHGSAPYRTYARPAPQDRTAGAGDTYTCAFALALAAGAHTPAAAELASAAASVVIDKHGTATCSAEELREHVAATGKHIQAVPRLAALVDLLRQQGRRVVFTNGCFDILHRGHVTYLNRAKALGDVLVVGVNADASVRRLKGQGRPITPLEDRAQVLAALSCVDYVAGFDEDTPAELIRAVRPDVYVKGGDYRRETLPETALVEDLGGAVQILPYVEDRSTTAIIERIRAAAAGARRGTARREATAHDSDHFVGARAERPVRATRQHRRRADDDPGTASSALRPSGA